MSGTTRPAWKVMLQLLLFLLGAALFLWLLNVLFKFDEGTYFPDVVDLLERQEWILAMLLGLGVVLVFEVLLLRPSPAAAPTEDWTLEEFESIDERYRVGCTGCGTVFDRRPNQLSETVFACPNCNRQGALRTISTSGVKIEEVECASCGTTFEKYREPGECPACHAKN